MSQIVRALTTMFVLENRKGVTAIEYGLIASLIAVAIIAAVTLVGTNLSTIFNTIADNL